MTTSEAYESLAICGLTYPGLRLLPGMPVNDLLLKISHVDGTRDEVERNISIALVAALAEASGALHLCEMARHVEYAAVIWVMENHTDGRAAKCIDQAIQRAVEIERERMERGWGDQAYKNN